MYQLSKKKLLQSFRHSDPLSSADALSAAGGGTVFSKLSTVSEQAEGDMEEDARGDQDYSLSAVECVGFCPLPEFKWVASGGMDKALKVWDITSGAVRCVCAHEDSVVALKWHYRVPIVATVALDLAIRLWDARSGVCLTVLTGHSRMVTNFDMAALPRPVPVGVSTSLADTSHVYADHATAEVSMAPAQRAPQHYTDVIVSVSDDQTAKVFLIDVPSLLTIA